jgi:hypothetical protein
MSNRIDKRVWGVLGKQQTFYSPQKQVEGKLKTPLNVNAFDSWDVKRSRFKRVDGYENAIQQGGVVPQETSTPVLSPTPTPTNTSSPTPTPTPSITATSTLTPTPTPSSTPPIPFDADAAAYLEAIVQTGGTLSPTISAATDTLFTSLKSNGLYSKLDVLYLFLGGVSASNALNGIRTNSSFDITWNGGMSFNSSGSTGNGTNGYGNTNYNPRTNSSALNASWGIYQTADNFFGEKHPFGAFDGTFLNVHRGENNGTIGLYGYEVSSARSFLTPNSFGGQFIATFSSASTKTLTYDRSNLSLSASTTAPAGGTALLPNQPYYLFTLNINGAPYSGQYYNGTLSSFFAGDFLSNSEITIIDGLINNFNTTLNRNLY